VTSDCSLRREEGGQSLHRFWDPYERESGRPPAHLLPPLADALNVTVDELVGYERLKEAQAPRNARLWRKLREIEKLGEADRKAVLRFVDALLAKQRFEHHRG
jgi:hypothetical protein